MTVSFAVDLPTTAEVNPFNAPTFRVRTDVPANLQWHESGVGEIPGETRDKLSLVMTPDDNGRAFFVVATDESGDQATSQTVTIAVGSPGVIADSVAENPDVDPSNVRWKETDFASTVVALEGQSSLQDDYRFTGRTFRRRDRTLNPRR